MIYSLFFVRISLLLRHVVCVLYVLSVIIDVFRFVSRPLQRILSSSFFFFSVCPCSKVVSSKLIHWSLSGLGFYGAQLGLLNWGVLFYLDIVPFSLYSFLLRHSSSAAYFFFSFRHCVSLECLLKALA